VVSGVISFDLTLNILNRLGEIDVEGEGKDDETEKEKQDSHLFSIINKYDRFVFNNA